MPEQLSIGERAGQGDMDAANGLAGSAADAQQAEPQGIGSGAFEFRSLHGFARLLDEHIGEGREHEAEGVGVEQVAGAALGEEVQPMLFHTVFRVAPGAVELLVELLGRMGGCRQGGHQEARIVLSSAAVRSGQDVGLGDHPASAKPARSRAPREGEEPPRRPAGGRYPGTGTAHRGRDSLLQTAVAGQADHVVDAGTLAPGEDRLPAEAGIGAQDDVGVRSALADPVHQPRKVLLDSRASLTQVGEEVHRLDKKKLARICKQMSKEIDALDAEIKAHLLADPDMVQRYRILRSVPGIGAINAAMLCCYMPELGYIGNRQTASLLGVAPFNRDSGKAERAGAGAARDGRFMAALSATRWNPDMKVLYERLTTRGKEHTVALVAVMRKLIILANVLLRDGREWARQAPQTVIAACG